MAGFLGLLAFVVAAILKLTNSHPGAILWLIIIGGILTAFEATYGWYRAGHTYRPPAP
jgi:hypothetical protein